MFRIGEFAQLARVSTRTLRHYDELGLFRPQHIDGSNGYRWYSADQLDDLNRIVTMTEFGFSLDEIRGLSHQDLSLTELRGMLLLKRAQLTEDIAVKQRHLLHLQSRIEQLDSDREPVDLRRKHVGALPVWVLRAQFADLDEVGEQVSAILKRLKPIQSSPPFAIVSWLGEFDDHNVELELAFSTKTSSPPVDLPLEASVLPGAEVVSAVRATEPERAHESHSAIGRWMEDEGVKIDGPVREVVLAHPAASGTQPVIEVQFPIRATLT